MIQPSYVFNEHRPIKANGVRSNQAEFFTVEMRMGKINYIAKGESKAKKEAQTLAAKDMIKYLLSTGQLTKCQVAKISGCANLVESPPENEPSLNKIELMKKSYELWQGGELTHGGKVILEKEQTDELRKRKREHGQRIDGAFSVGRKKRATFGIFNDDEKSLAETLVKIDSEKYNCETFHQQKSESPEIIEINDVSHDDDVIMISTTNSSVEQVNMAPCQASDLRRKFPAKFASFDEQIWLHWRQNAQDDETFQWKMRVRVALLDLAKHVISDCRLFAVGSTVNCCGSYNSDMDLCLTVPDQYFGFDTERNFDLDVLRGVQTHFRRFGRHLVRQVQLIPAKVPILKLAFQPPYHQLEVDLNCNNVAGVYNSHLLHYYAKVDDRFPALCLTAKHWAIKTNINDAMTGTLNSYSLILMFVHYLQCAVSPPVLPNLQKLFPQLFTGQQAVHELQLFKDFPGSIPGHKSNKQSVGELLLGFFNYYSSFPFDSLAISIRNATTFDRSCLPSDTGHFKIYIEEPFDEKNTARCVTKPEKMARIQTEFRKTVAILTDGGPSLAAINVEI